MNLRRAMAAAAATAAIAPIALLAAPTAYADDTASPTPSASVSDAPSDSSTESQSPSDDPSASDSPSASTSEAAPGSGDAPASTPPAASGKPAPSDSASASSPAPSDSATDEPPTGEPTPCEDSKVDVSISGLPGRIAAGSGWHKFSLNVLNKSDSTLNGLDFFAGASSDKEGNSLFTSKQVQLQAWNPDDNAWEALDEGGNAVGYVGSTDELKPDYEVDIPLRINVTRSAPVGAGFSLGATIYGDTDGACTGFGDVSYKFQIVAAGSDTNGTKPQEGGEAPVTSEKPAASTPKVTGSLAHTGASSALPVIGFAGAAAVVAGAGAVFVVRRRKAAVSADA